VRHFVPGERLERGYFRRWLHQNGQDVARLERAYTPSVVRWLGVPRYLWREAGLDAWTILRAAIGGDARRRFAASVRVAWFLGYVREAWFHRSSARRRALRLA